jgi:hypothetical protein
MGYTAILKFYYNCGWPNPFMNLLEESWATLAVCLLLLLAAVILTFALALGITVLRDNLAPKPPTDPLRKKIQAFPGSSRVRDSDVSQILKEYTSY